jgi:hypothetical protein
VFFGFASNPGYSGFDHGMFMSGAQVDLIVRERLDLPYRIRYAERLPMKPDMPWFSSQSGGIS